ncbi:hypothetical protein [Streptomyces sp. SudanB25_2051]|uniref:hypothetical protein n=1 Tax=Streptomyces sp. SudanB25_2051 TaxID=3035275 RepID=UPI003F549779
MNHHDEDGLRRALRALAEQDGTVDAAPPTGALVARGRRTRHRRRALAAGAATALVAVGSALGVRGTGAAPAETPTAARQSPTASPADDADGHFSRLVKGGVHLPQPPSADRAALDSGPRRAPVELVRYRYDLSTVCDLRYAVFGGRVWEAPPHAWTASWVSDRVRGLMRLQGRGGSATAVFEIDGPLSGPGAPAWGGEIVFRPLAGGTPTCLAQEPPRRYSDSPAASAGPARPVEGAVYAFDWPTACDKWYVAFGGRLWKAGGRVAPGALDCLVDDLPVAAYARIVDGRLQLSKADPLRAPGTKVWTYHPVDRPDGAHPAPCPDTLAVLERIARGTTG